MKKNITLKVLAFAMVICMLVPAMIACKDKNPQKDDDATYTYNGAFTLSPSTFNPLDYKSTTDKVPLDYTTNSLYETAYNADGTGFEYVPVMAAADPIDVTSEYAGDDKVWGIAADATSGFAFRIKLNPDAKWDNGDAITADDYIYTLQQQLDPTFNLYRASDYYQGSMRIVGAKDYYYSGQTTWQPAVDVYGDDIAVDDWSAKGLYFDASNVSAFDTIFGETDMTALEVYKTYFQVGDKNVWDDLSGYAGENRTALTAEIAAELASLFGENGALGAYWGWSDAKVGYFTVAEKAFPEYKWEDVGLKKIDDYTLDIILANELVGFYIKYTLGLPLVYKPLYESCKKQDSVTGVWSSSYGTSVETYMGYGPFKMTEYIVDQSMKFEKSATWFGYAEKYTDTYGDFVREVDGKSVKQYQTTAVALVYAKEISTREEMFLAGKLDVLGLNKAMYDSYKASKRLYNATGASTFYGIVLSDYASLVEREAVQNGTTYSTDYNGAVQKYNKTILSISEFRQALCYALDRAQLVTNLYPGGSPAISLFSDLIIADPENGIAFNSFTSTKEAICDFWGVEYGEGKDFATLEDAYKSITGFDMTSSKKLVDEAVKIAKEKGYMGDDTIVRIDYCAANDSETEQLWFQTMKNCFDEMVKGTSLEGKFQMDYNTNLGSDFGGAIQSGKADTSWGFGWSGGELDPYDLCQVYVDAAGGEDEPYQYDKWMNRDTDAYLITLTLDIGDGAKEYTFTAYDWWQMLNGLDNNEEGLANWKYTKVPDSVRAEVLAAIEKAILLDYTNIPMMNEGSVQLLSYKCNYGKEAYMFGMGFGGLRYITYNFSDAEWTNYLVENNGALTY